MCIQICEINFQQLKFVVYREYFKYMERTFVFCPVNNRSFTEENLGMTFHL